MLIPTTNLNTTISFPTKKLEIFKRYSMIQCARLLVDPNVKRRFSNNAKASVTLADNYLRALGRFCREVDLTSPILEYEGIPIRIDMNPIKKVSRFRFRKKRENFFALKEVTDTSCLIHPAKVVSF